MTELRYSDQGELGFTTGRIVKFLMLRLLRKWCELRRGQSPETSASPLRDSDDVDADSKVRSYCRIYICRHC